MYLPAVEGLQYKATIYGAGFLDNGKIRPGFICKHENSVLEAQVYWAESNWIMLIGSDRYTFAADEVDSLIDKMIAELTCPWLQWQQSLLGYGISDMPLDDNGDWSHTIYPITMGLYYDDGDIECRCTYKDDTTLVRCFETPQNCTTDLNECGYEVVKSMLAVLDRTRRGVNAMR